MDKTAYIKKQRMLMKKTKEILLVKLIIMAIVTVISTLIAILRLPSLALGIWGIILCAISYITCMKEMNDVFFSVFKWNASNDSFAAFSLILVFIRSISLLFGGEQSAEIFSPMLFLAITVSLGVKRSFASGIADNIEVVKDAETYLVGSFKDENGRKYCKATKSEELPDIVQKSYVVDPSERRGRRFVPFIYLLILLLSLIAMYLRGVTMFFTAISALSVAAASLTGEMAFVVPYNTLQARMRKRGMIFFGYTSISALKNVSAIVLEDKELFPEENTGVKKITITSAKTEIAIRYIDRILKETNSPTRNVFENLDILEGGIPLSVEKVKYVKDQGVIATINEDKVLFGTRNLLLANNIEPYSQEKEATVLEEGTVMTYLSINGELSAALLFEYGRSDDLKNKIERISDLDFVIKTKDAAIDRSTIEKDFGIKKTRLFITDEEEYTFFTNYEEKLKSGEAKVAMITTNGASEIPSLVVLTKDMASIFKYTITSKHFSIIVGILLSFISLMVSPSSLNFAWFLIYNIIWLLPILILSSYRRK